MYGEFASHTGKSPHDGFDIEEIAPDDTLIILTLLSVRPGAAGTITHSEGSRADLFVLINVA